MLWGGTFFHRFFTRPYIDMKKRPTIPKSKKLEKHLEEHPADYQAVIALLKARSDEIEHRLYEKRIERLKKVHEVRLQRAKH